MHLDVPADPPDGFGTYDDETQAAPVMSFVGSRGYFVSRIPAVADMGADRFSGS